MAKVPTNDTMMETEGINVALKSCTGEDAATALSKASGQYGRVADAARLIDPRK